MRSNGLETTEREDAIGKDLLPKSMVRNAGKFFHETLATLPKEA